jgi:hypothetical protein
MGEAAGVICALSPIDIASAPVKPGHMGSPLDDERRRVFVPQALGADEFLRVTWHEQRQVMVFSHWQGAECIAATPVRIDELGELAELIVCAYTRTIEAGRTEWPAPNAADVVIASAAIAS